MIWHTKDFRETCIYSFITHGFYGLSWASFCHAYSFLLNLGFLSSWYLHGSFGLKYHSFRTCLQGSWLLLSLKGSFHILTLTFATTAKISVRYRTLKLGQQFKNYIELQRPWLTRYLIAWASKHGMKLFPGHRWAKGLLPGLLYHALLSNPSLSNKFTSL